MSNPSETKRGAEGKSSASPDETHSPSRPKARDVDRGPGWEPYCPIEVNNYGHVCWRQSDDARPGSRFCVEHGRRLVTDGGTDDAQPPRDEAPYTAEPGRCGYCDTTELVYELNPGPGRVVFRCIECLAIEQGQQQFNLPFDVWLDQGMIEPPEGEDAPDFEPVDPREHDYKAVQAWFRVLARLKDDDPVVKPDPDAPGATIFEDTREFLINVMGEDAHKRPSALRSQDGETDA